MKNSLKITFSLTLIIIISLLAFSLVFQSGFLQWDDDFHVTNNPFIRSLDLWHIQQIFTQTINKIYIPLTTLTYAVEYHFFQLNPFVYHLTNLLLHLGVVCLIFFFTLQLKFSLRIAAYASLLFAVHPMHVESVVWITERKDVLYAFFYLSSILNYCTYLNSQKKSNYGLSLLFGFLSILSKPMALSLPLILFVCDWWHKDDHSLKSKKKLLILKIPYFLYIVPITWITYSLHARIPGEGISKSLLTWIWSFSFYLIKFFYPVKLSPLYTQPLPISLSNPIYLLSVAVFSLSMLSICLFRKNRLFLFAWLYYFLSIFFLLRFDAKADFGIVTDRFMYLPSLGFCLLLGYYFGRDTKLLPYKQPRIISAFTNVIFIVLVALLSLNTFKQSKIWVNSLNLWNYIIATNPNSAIAYNNRANVYDKLEKHDLAIKDFDRALAIDPIYIEGLCNRGTLAYFYEKSLSKALHYYDRALFLNSRSSSIYYLLGVIYAHNNNYRKAEESFIKSYTNNPSLTCALTQLSKLYILTQEDQKAITTLNQILKFNLSQNDQKKFWSQLAGLYFRNGEMGKSELFIKRIFTHNSPQNFILLAKTFDNMAISGTAFELMNTALSLYPKNKELYSLYGDLLVNQNKFEAAIDAWERGHQLAPYDERFLRKIQQTKKFITQGQN